MQSSGAVLTHPSCNAAGCFERLDQNKEACFAFWQHVIPVVSVNSVGAVQNDIKGTLPGSCIGTVSAVTSFGSTSRSVLQVMRVVSD
eukprot:1430438-Amphidinium_carterae.1